MGEKVWVVQKMDYHIEGVFASEASARSCFELCSGVRADDPDYMGQWIYEEADFYR